MATKLFDTVVTNNTDVAINAVVAQMLQVDLAAIGANVVVTFPAGALVGQCIGIVLTTTDDVSSVTADGPVSPLADPLTKAGNCALYTWDGTEWAVVAQWRPQAVRPFDSTQLYSPPGVGATVSPPPGELACIDLFGNGGGAICDLTTAATTAVDGQVIGVQLVNTDPGSVLSLVGTFGGPAISSLRNAGDLIVFTWSESQTLWVVTSYTPTPYTWQWADADARMAQALTAADAGKRGYQVDMDLAYEVAPFSLAWTRLEDPRIGPKRTATARNNIAIAPSLVGLDWGVTSGTNVARQASSGATVSTRQVRAGYDSGAGAASRIVYWPAASAAANNSCVPAAGFRSRIRVVLNTTSGAMRWFAAAYVSTVVAANVDPNTILDVVSIGRGATDANLQLYHNNGAGAAVQVDLGASFPAATAGEGYELEVYAPNATSWRAQVTALNTGLATSRTFTTDIPSTLQGGPLFYGCNNTDAVSVGVDMALLETAQLSN